MSHPYYDGDIKIYRAHGSAAYAADATRKVNLTRYTLPDEPDTVRPQQKQTASAAKKKKNAVLKNSASALLTAELALLLVLVLLLTLTVLQLGKCRAQQLSMERELESIRNGCSAMEEIISAGAHERLLSGDGDPAPLEETLLQLK